MTDRFKTRSASSDGSATDGFPITPSDVSELSEVTRALFIGTAGDVTIVLPSSAELLFKNIASGTVLPIRAHYVRATGTTATDIVGLV